ncbi:hypothetical protein K8O92_25070 [Nocardia asteroides]|nr:hypothetical protein K8O92_25070 [Nocardia asteroides]
MSTGSTSAQLLSWEITDDYLGGGGSRTYDNAGGYTDNSDGQITHVTVYEWRHALSDVIGALLRAGLHIEAVAELPYMDWRGFPELVACPQGWALTDGAPRIPLNFAVTARRTG